MAQEATNHELRKGDELNDGSHKRFRVEKVHDDGSVTVSITAGEMPFDETSDTEQWTHEEVVNGLVDSTIVRDDGLSHELVKSF